uniref:Single stranded DNA binding protein 4 n=2 Tax=Sinocyclocheilus TaxID=75365 RepID=A0A671NYA7_9TELE
MIILVFRILFYIYIFFYLVLCIPEFLVRCHLLNFNSPNNMAGMNNPPGTPRDDGEMAGNFLNPFQSESYSPNMTMSV